MIIYFTGTGNSQYLADILNTHLHNEIVDAAEMIQNTTYPVLTSETPYVFVAPVYAWRLPRVFEEWIQKCTFAGNKKAYFVLNCGSGIGNASKYAKKLCEKKGFEYMGMAEILMPENYIALFRAPSEKTTRKILGVAEEKTAPLPEKIAAGIPFEPVKVNLVGRLCSGLVNAVFYQCIISSKKFYTTEACISCGKCVRNCMLNNIVLVEGKPVWGKNCTHCMACINKCPTEAIEYGKHTKGLRRYTCPKKDENEN